MTSAKRIQVEPNIYKYKTAKAIRYMVRLQHQEAPHTRYGFRSIVHARNYLQELFKEPTERPGETPTLKEYYETKWWPEWKIHLKRRTIRDYEEKMEQHILPQLGDYDLPEITRGRLREWLLNLEGKKLSHTTIRHIVTPLSALLGSAVDEELIKYNPIHRLSKVLKLKKIRKPQYKAYRPDETKKILVAAKEHFPQWYAFVATLFLSGIRWSEACALDRDEDLDLDAGNMMISKNLSDGFLEDTTKGGEPRQVPLTKTLKKILHSHLDTLNLNNSYSKQNKKKTKVRLLFSNSQGTYIHHSNFLRRVWQPLLKQAKVRYLSPHKARHTFATRLLERDASLSKVQQLLGHASIQLTVDTYGHLVTAETRKAIDLLEEE